MKRKADVLVEGNTCSSYILIILISIRIMRLGYRQTKIIIKFLNILFSGDELLFTGNSNQVKVPRTIKTNVKVSQILLNTIELKFFLNRNFYCVT